MKTLIVPRIGVEAAGKGPIRIILSVGDFSGFDIKPRVLTELRMNYRRIRYDYKRRIRQEKKTSLIMVS